jgi:glycosyltransferase involved in cell wall biosynthesis
MDESECPLVSLIVPVFNGGPYVRESLESILGQTYPSLEVIVVDDASTDSTPEILASYGNRIRVHRQEKTRGIYGNANDGIGLARGELVGVFHADDVYAPDLVEREVDWLLAHPGAGAVFCCVVFMDRDGREFARQELPPEVRGNRELAYGEVLNTLLLRKNTFLACPTALVRADVYRDVGGYRDEQFKNTSDVEMWLRIARSYGIGVLEDQLLRYRRGHGSSSELYHGLRTEPFRLFEILDLELEAAPPGVATPRALRGYHAHRAEDLALRAVNHYILGRPDSARALLGALRVRSLVGSAAVQRWRLLLLVLALRVLVRLPRVSAVARLFAWRWHREKHSATSEALS